MPVNEGGTCREHDETRDSLSLLDALGVKWAIAAGGVPNGGCGRTPFVPGMPWCHFAFSTCTAVQ